MAPITVWISQRVMCWQICSGFGAGIVWCCLPAMMRIWYEHVMRASCGLPSTGLIHPPQNPTEQGIGIGRIQPAHNRNQTTFGFDPSEGTAGADTEVAGFGQAGEDTLSMV